MAKSGIITLPLLRGVLGELSPWQTTFGRAGMRVYPYQTGCLVAADNNGSTTISTHGMGEFAANDYLMVGAMTFYGDSYLFIPDTNRITRVSSLGSSSDQIVTTTALTVYEGDYLFNLGADAASDPTAQPNYDGSTLTLYDDNVGANASSLNYFLTGSGGFFRGWLSSGTLLADLLITNESGQPVLMVPFYEVGTEVLA